MADLLLELFSEEIPARMQADATRRLVGALEEHLKQQGYSDLAYDSFREYVTPRRLAVQVFGLPAQQADASTERKGPKVGAPEAAVRGFLKSTGLSLKELEERDGVYFARIRRKGRPTAEVLKGIIEKFLAGFPWPKSMRDGADHTWVRPLHNILCLFDGNVVPVEFGGLKANAKTFGHRFLAPKAITIKDATKYESALEKAFVIADAEKRKARIAAEAEKLATAKGLSLKQDEGLLNKVTGLVEWPVMLMGSIDADYMTLPPEVLMTAMRYHQKYFALYSPSPSGRGESEARSEDPRLLPEGKGITLAPHFLIVSNMETKDNGRTIIAGNERVLRARFADAAFFWEQDRKKPLVEWAKGLAGVTYHARLGSVADKVGRVKALATLVAEKTGADKTSVARAVELCKADLVTGMVGEFPELQGVMGRYYALSQEENKEVADAVRDHYAPQGPSDTCPSAPVSVCVALADKLDTLMSLFFIGEKPTGSKDPFALRRAALGVIRILLENNVTLPLRALSSSYPGAHGAGDDVSHDLLAFLADRLKVQLKDQGIRHDLIAAVFALGEDDLVRLVARVKALQDFLGADDGANLLVAYRRASNIVAIEEKKDGGAYADTPDGALLKQPEEIALFAALDAAGTQVAAALKSEDFMQAMTALSTLRAPVDAFFDHVLVNDEDAALRANRLKLLAGLRRTMDQVADFSHAET